jgi:hypothetical protein
MTSERDVLAGAVADHFQTGPSSPAWRRCQGSRPGALVGGSEPTCLEPPAALAANRSAGQGGGPIMGAGADAGPPTGADEDAPPRHGRERAGDGVSPVSRLRRISPPSSAGSLGMGRSSTRSRGDPFVRPFDQEWALRVRPQRQRGWYRGPHASLHGPPPGSSLEPPAHSRRPWHRVQYRSVRDHAGPGTR